MDDGGTVRVRSSCVCGGRGRGLLGNRLWKISSDSQLFNGVCSVLNGDSKCVCTGNDG